ncbi:serine/threonine-protein phosphatase [Leptospira ognonensis]|uniref:Serine/threonine-protein phosphatase n=1 Tax=Leptospira ognonensis TaxID=2484945 RepID=A0A4R9KBQ1_9LEPT|nr:PP2C family protein-serine/threonine phosphatase [Leptospira ognonensis]TGL62263.1 serine/threonine-protein phosphatase [Leptospira ognonensis]
MKALLSNFLLHLSIAFLTSHFFLTQNLTATPILIDPNSKMSVAEGWTFHTNDKGEVPIQVGTSLSLQGFPPPTSGTYKLEFLFPETLLTPAQGIYLNRIQEADKVFLNGQLIAETGNFEPYGRYSPNWYFKRLYYLPDSLLRRGEINVLEVKVYYQSKTFPGGIFRSVPEIGSYNQLLGNIIFEDGRDVCIMLLFFGIGAYQIFSILIRRQRKANFYLLCSSLCFVFWRVPLLNITHTYSGLEFITLLKIFFTFQTLFPLALFLFSYALFRDPIRLKESLLIIIVGSIAIIQLFNIEIATRILLLRIWEGLLLIIVYFVLRGVYLASKIYKNEARMLGIGFFIVCVSGIIDISIDLTTGKNVYLTQYGFLILMILSAVTISFRNAKNEKELSELTKDLEARVQIRTEELRKKNNNLQQDLFFASQLQGHLLPKESPSITGLKLHPTYLPMEQIGGDFYDWVKVNDTNLIFFIADVAGHGVPAALVSSMVKVQFREIVKETTDPAQLLGRMNLSLIQLVSKYFITASCALFDLEKGEVTISSAGHPNPLIYNPIHHSFRFLNLRGSILGWRETFSYQNVIEKLSEGDRYFFYTDGVTEARSNEKFFGEANLIRIIKENRNNDIQSLSENLQIEIMDYSDTELKDDVSYVIIEILQSH